MNAPSSFAANPFASKPRSPEQRSRASTIFAAGGALLPLLEAGQSITSAHLCAVLTTEFGGSDAEGFWSWKDAYEATEVAQLLFLRKFGSAISARTNTPEAALSILTRLTALIPTHTRRSEESQRLQQFSTPLPLGYVAARAAGIMADDVVLEPSAGTGLMAIFGEIARARLVLNEYAPFRHFLLEHLFPGAPVTHHDAAHIADYLDRAARPTVVLMNPPFSAGAHVEGRMADAAWRHLTSAFARLAPGGRLVAITGSSLSPGNPKWRDAFLHLQERGKGLETLAADRMTLKDRKLVYTHPVTGAQSHLLTIERMDRNRPMLIEDALRLVARDPRAKLMINAKSERAAVMAPTRSNMLEDGSLQPRVALIRPMDELRVEIRHLEETNWEEADEQVFAAAWNAEVANVSAYSTSILHVVSDLLLPIWKLLPQDYCRVYRLQTDDGERIVGRVIAPAGLSRLCNNLGIDRSEVLDPEQAWKSVVDGSSIISLAGEMTVRCVRVMNDNRVELTGFTDGMRDWLRAIGLFSEMIAWKLRFFIPVTDEGAAILSRLTQRHRLLDVISRH